MKPKFNRFIEWLPSFVVWIFPVLSMLPTWFSAISAHEKIVIYVLMLFTTTIIFFLVWMAFFWARKNNLMKRMLPSSDCNKCENLLCCLKVIRPGVNYKDEIFKLESSEFIDEFELATLEAKLPLQEVWIISPDLSYECEDTFFTEVVKRNLKAGIKYKFITQDNSDSRENQRTIYTKYTNKITRLLYKRRLKFYRVKAPEFNIVLSLYSIVVYNPNPKKSKYERRVYICVGENGEKVHSVYKEIDNAHHINMTLDTIRSIMDSAKSS